MNLHIEPKRPESRRRLSRVLVALVMGAALFAGVAHLTSPSVVVGEGNATAAPSTLTPPKATSDPHLFRREADATSHHVVVNRLADIEEPDTRGDSIAFFER